MPISNHGSVLDIISFWGKVLSQHQTIFTTDGAGEEYTVAWRVLSLLAAQHAEKSNCAKQPGSSFGSRVPTYCTADITQRLFQTSFAPRSVDFTVAVEAVRASNCTNDQLAFEIIPAVARKLGKAWEGDLISFADVTIGCARLQAMLRQLPDGHGSSDGLARLKARRSQCLVIVPQGAQHTLGALVLAKRLRSAGQGVTLELDINQNTLSYLRKEQSFECVLISASKSENVSTLRDMVAVLRLMWAKSKIVIGGSICEQHLDLLEATQADLVTSEWEKVVEICA